MGYSKDRFRCPLYPQVICTICYNVFCEPVQTTTCQHAFCKQCICTWLEVSNVCPRDGHLLSQSHLEPVTGLLQNTLEELQMACSFAPYGCEQVVKMQHLADHCMKCEFNVESLEVCGKKCGAFFMRRDIESHYCFSFLMEENIRLKQVIEEKRYFAKELFDVRSTKYHKVVELVYDMKILNDTAQDEEREILQLVEAKNQKEMMISFLLNDTQPTIGATGDQAMESETKVDTKCTFDGQLPVEVKAMIKAEDTEQISTLVKTEAEEEPVTNLWPFFLWNCPKNESSPTSTQSPNQNDMDPVPVGENVKQETVSTDSSLSPVSSYGPTSASRSSFSSTDSQASLPPSPPSPHVPGTARGNIPPKSRRKSFNTTIACNGGQRLFPCNSSKSSYNVILSSEYVHCIHCKDYKALGLICECKESNKLFLDKEALDTHLTKKRGHEFVGKKPKWMTDKLFTRIKHHSTTNTVIACKGCQKEYKCFSGKRGRKYPTFEFYVHCLQDCDKYKKLGYMRVCEKCRCRFLDNYAFGKHKTCEKLAPDLEQFANALDVGSRMG